MSKKKILFVTQEMEPYNAITEIAEIVRQLPTYAHEHGMEIRILMPRFGVINERRHRLHEVVRLSGMNIIVDDDDYPLIIKVASMPGARLQVYFLDNEEFFKRKYLFEDEAGHAYEDNADRMVFFCKGVIETVKKFGWPPDIIHCLGWMTSLIPFYLKTAYKNEPIFKQSKIVYSVYQQNIPPNLDRNFYTKAAINNLHADQLKAFANGQGLNLDKGAITYADAIILGSENLDKAVKTVLEDVQKPILNYQDVASLLPAYQAFYEELSA